ncbi:cytochrome c-type biogenesis protein CcmF [Streptomyces zinciresistens K42]|uniref:Cytochrome c-type biogenesis protein CcmF n=1 Tax=Streptomyces zinciresistens K42 TaxID=700597 RepID=G2GM62_9ACTN|nr:heme lyase CcmF/NrfE family subunit [Streptomyces zinciresistens]EGX55409.1 cytochrome c-type biogenesis protein CcmF [Streptomyces zinciresistens K42]
MNLVAPAAGWAALVLGLAGSLGLALFGFRAQRNPGSVSRARLRFAVLCALGGAVAAMAALQVALLTDNFSVSYVAETHARATPLLFTITSAWSALGGSLVLWSLVLTGFTATVLRQVRDTDDRLGTGALGVLGLVNAFFFGLLASSANPFRILSDPPADGPGPNPILADNIMVAFHPPMLYMGFVGFTVPFAFAMSALLLRRGGVDWLRRTRRANLVAWTFLTGGLVLGAWWSYEVLGWGGFWAWDPVENAALIPWLVATAFIHSSAVQLKRGMLQAWNFVLVIATFALTILGTFLTRSGVVSSVHAFSQSGVGPALLVFLLVVLAGGFTLFALRGERMASVNRPESLVSREGVLLLNNLLLTLFAFVVLTGTLYPIFAEAMTGRQLSVGRPFFDRMAVPLSFALLLAMGVGPFTPYRHASPAVLWQRLRVALLLAGAAAAAVVLAGVDSPGVVAVVAIAVGILTGSVRQLLATAPKPRRRGIPRVLLGQRAYWGGQLAHLGLVLVAVVIAVSSAFATRATVTLDRGDSARFAGYQITFDRTERHRQPDRESRDAHIVFREGGRVVWTATPRLNRFTNQTQQVGQPAVKEGVTRDLYVALAQYDTSKVSLNLYRYPFMSWLWVGGLLMAAGGLWALSGRRRGGADRPADDQAPAGESPRRQTPEAVTADA